MFNSTVWIILSIFISFHCSQHLKHECRDIELRTTGIRLLSYCIPERVTDIESYNIYIVCVIYKFKHVYGHTAVETTASCLDKVEDLKEMRQRELRGTKFVTCGKLKLENLGAGVHVVCRIGITAERADGEGCEFNIQAAPAPPVAAIPLLFERKGMYHAKFLIVHKDGFWESQLFECEGQESHLVYRPPSCEELQGVSLQEVRESYGLIFEDLHVFECVVPTIGLPHGDNWTCSAYTKSWQTKSEPCCNHAAQHFTQISVPLQPLNVTISQVKRQNSTLVSVEIIVHLEGPSIQTHLRIGYCESQLENSTCIETDIVSIPQQLTKEILQTQVNLTHTMNIPLLQVNRGVYAFASSIITISKEQELELSARESERTYSVTFGDIPWHVSMKVEMIPTGHRITIQWKAFKSSSYAISVCSGSSTCIFSSVIPLSQLQQEGNNYNFMVNTKQPIPIGTYYATVAPIGNILKERKHQRIDVYVGKHECLMTDPIDIWSVRHPDTHESVTTIIEGMEYIMLCLVGSIVVPGPSGNTTWLCDKGEWIHKAHCQDNFIKEAVRLHVGHEERQHSILYSVQLISIVMMTTLTMVLMAMPAICKHRKRITISSNRRKRSVPKC